MLHGEVAMKDIRPLQDANYESGLLYARNTGFSSGGRGKSHLLSRGGNPNEYEYVWDMSTPEAAAEFRGLLKASDGKMLQALDKPGSPCCPEIHVHVHQNTDGGPTVTTLSRIQVQASADPPPLPPGTPCAIHGTSPRVKHHTLASRSAASRDRTPDSRLMSTMGRKPKKSSTSTHDSSIPRSSSDSGNENSMTKRYMTHPVKKTPKSPPTSKHP